MLLLGAPSLIFFGFLNKDGGRTGIFDRPAFVLQPTLASDRGEIRIY